jgi:hypothetical protein
VFGISKFGPDPQKKQFGRTVHYLEIGKSLVGQAFVQIEELIFVILRTGNAVTFLNPNNFVAGTCLSCFTVLILQNKNFL